MTMTDKKGAKARVLGWFAAKREAVDRFMYSGLGETALGLQAIGAGAYFHDPLLIGLGTISATHGINVLARTRSAEAVKAGLQHPAPA